FAQMAGDMSPRGLPRVGEPEAARGVTEAVVPVRRRRRELAGAPSVRPEVPRFGDEFLRAQQRIGRQCHEERVARAEAGAVPSEGDGEVEPETVDADLACPVPQ